MKLIEAFRLVPEQYYGNPMIVYQNNKPLVAGTFISYFDWPPAKYLNIMDDSEPFQLLPCREKQIVFYVK